MPGRSSLHPWILKKTILFRDKVLHPLRQPRVLIGLLRAILLARRSLREPGPPRCLYLVPSLPGNTGGIERHEVAVCRALSDLAFSIEVLSIHGAPGGGVISGTSRITVRGHSGRRVALVWSAIGAALRRRPRLVLVEHVNLAPLGWVLARLRGARFVVFTHGLEVWDPLPFLRRWALARADRVLCVSRYTADHVIGVNRVPAPKVRVVYNCLDPAFVAESGRRTGSGGPRILTVSRLWRADGYKGHAEIMRAVAELRHRFPGLVYDVVGDGDGRPDLEALAAGMGLTDVVRFRGRVTEAELRQLYADADAFVMTSTGEGFGLVFVEAMAQGTPVIGSRADATPEVVSDGETGLLVDPSSHEQLVDALTAILGDASLRERMGRAAARRARDTFGFDRFRGNLERSLAELRVV